QLQMAGVTVLLFKEPRTFDEAKQRLRTIGKAVDRQERATALISVLEKDIETLKSKLTARQGQAKPKALFLYLRGPQTAFVFGKDSSPGAMLELVGATNAAGKITGTKPMTAEAVIAAQPDVYVLFESGLKSIGGVEGLLKIPGLAQTPAGRGKRVVAMDGLYLSGFGPRCGRAALDLFRGIYESEGHFIAKGE
ncbi:ABC transporter substrate-binding protein, partial [Candidatus Poribacteria bacterium]|nr:ABC transporter substrate-binding protein [Candidatus Poribacteria bacterium]